MTRVLHRAAHLCALSTLASLCLFSATAQSQESRAPADLAVIQAQNNPGASDLSAVEKLLKLETPSRTYAGLGERLQLPLEAQIGQGISIVPETVRSTGILNDSDQIAQGNENAIAYDLRIIENYEELARTLNISASASYSGLSGGVSASMNLFKSARITSRNVYVLVSMTVENGSDTISHAMLSSNALALLGSRPVQLDAFKTRYGDTFVSRVVRGAHLYALMEFATHSDEEKEDLRITVDGSLGAFKAGGSYESTLKTLSDNHQVHILYTQSGGGTGRDGAPAQAGGFDFAHGGVITVTPEELISRLREFPAEVRRQENRANGAILYVNVQDYSAAENWPTALQIEPPQIERWTLQDMARDEYWVKQAETDAREEIDNGRFADPADVAMAKKVLAYSTYTLEQIDRLKERLRMFPSDVTLVANNELLLPFDADAKNFVYSSPNGATRCKAAIRPIEVFLNCLRLSSVSYSRAPQHVVILQDGIHAYTRSFWGGGSHSWECARDMGSEFVLISGGEQSFQIGSEWEHDPCIGQYGGASANHCDQGLNEHCEQIYLPQACLVNRSWVDWYRKGHGAMPAYAEACSVPSSDSTRSQMTSMGQSPKPGNARVVRRSKSAAHSTKQQQAVQH